MVSRSHKLTFIEQEHDASCAPSAIANGLRTRGWYVSEPQLTKLLGTHVSKNGTSVKSILRFFKKQGWPHEQLWFKSTTAMMASLKGLADADVVTWLLPAGHISLLVGKGPSGLLVFDPSLGMLAFDDLTGFDNYLMNLRSCILVKVPKPAKGESLK